MADRIKLQGGDAAPRFDLKDQREQTVKNDDFRGRRLLVYFYPKADTPGCTAQACGLQDNLQALEKLDIAVVGISPDAPAAQQQFAEKYNLTFPLLSDPEHAVAAAYGAWGEKNMYGKKSEGMIRSAFLIDEDGNIIRSRYQVPAKETADWALKHGAA